MNPIHFDCMRNVISVGDYIALDHRDGNSSKMSISCVVELDPDDPKRALLAGGSFDYNRKFRANARKSRTDRLNQSVSICSDYMSSEVETALVRLMEGGAK